MHTKCDSTTINTELNTRHHLLLSSPRAEIHLTSPTCAAEDTDHFLTDGTVSYNTGHTFFKGRSMEILQVHMFFRYITSGRELSNH